MSSGGENSEVSEAIVLHQARLFFSLPEKRELSYKDLYDIFLKENGAISQSSSSEDSESENYSYPAFMQRIIERLDRYGQLANSEEIGMHKSDPRKRRKIEENLKENTQENNEDKEESENSYEQYYDLSDDFIDDGDIKIQTGNEENEITKAINEGFFVLSIEDYAKSLPRTPKKTKKVVKEKKEIVKVDFQKKLDVDISHLSDEIKEKVEELRKLYEQKRKEGNPAPFPKGSMPIFEKIIAILGPSVSDVENLYNNISSISKQTPESISIQFGKIRQKLEKNFLQLDYSRQVKVFKKKLQSSDLKWNLLLKTEFFQVLEALNKYVNSMNSPESQKGKKVKSLMVYAEEEGKLILELKKASNGKLENVDLKSEIFELPVIPRISDRFEDPIMKVEDFDPIS